MTIPEKAAQFVENTANDPKHGYDQRDRWGVDYDCSSLVITAYKQAGLDLHCTYTGDMLSDMLHNGFVIVPLSAKQRGDILLNVRSHAAMYLGNGKLGQASISENGTIYADQKGDQTGDEINIRNYYNFPWDYCLHYATSEEASEYKPTGFNLVYNGIKSNDVYVLQGLLNHFNNQLDVDGEFGGLTESAVRYFQECNSLEVDGIVGKETWGTLFRKVTELV